MALKVTNNGTSKLAGSIIASDSQLSVEAGTGSRFPSLGEGDWFPLVAVDSSGNREIMKVTARHGDLLTVSRGQEGTAARSFSAGDRVDLRLTAAAISQFVDVDENLGDVSDKALARQNLGLGDAATKDVGTDAGTVAAGDDSRIVNATPKTRTITAEGLAQGGGDLSANRTITVPKANEDEAEAGENDTKAMTPAMTKAAILALTPGGPSLGTAAAEDVGLEPGNVVQLDEDGNIPGELLEGLLQAPSEQTRPVGWSGYMALNLSGGYGGVLSADAEIEGSRVIDVVFSHNDAGGTPQWSPTNNTQAGTWKNISGVQLTQTPPKFGIMVRIA